MVPDGGEERGWRPGVRLGPFRLEARLGAGGMGEVWRAVDTRLGRTVALKRIAVGVVGADAWERFLTEARAQAAIRSVSVATLYDIVEDPEQGGPFLVMELVEGPSLQSVLAEGPLETERALAILRGVAEGLAAAHRLGVIHRDLKPANVLLRPDGTPVLVDFGIALLAPTTSEVEEVVGTLDWMAPEQLSGGAITPATDVWAAGVLLFRMLTGRLPFDGETPMERLAASLSGGPVPLARLRPDVPAVVRRLVESCLERDPRRRIRDGRELLHRIPPLTLPVMTRRAALLAPDVVAEESAHPPLARHHVLAAALAGVAGVALLTLAAVRGWGPVEGPWLPPREGGRRALVVAERAGVLPEGGHAAGGYTLGTGRTPILWGRVSPEPLLDPDRPPTPVWPPPHHPGEVRVLCTPRGRLLRWDWWPDGTRRADPAAVLEELAGGGAVRPAGEAAGVQRGLPVERWRSEEGAEFLVASGAAGIEIGARSGVDPPPEPGRLVSPPVSLAMLVTVLAAAVLAVRRVRRRDADPLGGVVVTASLVVLHSLKLVANPVTLVTGIWWDQLLLSLGVGLVLGVFYVGLEPEVRAHFPGAMTGWLRLLGRRPGDPQVARELLLGAAAGLPAGALLLGLSLLGKGALRPDSLALGASSWGLFVFGLAAAAELAVVTGFLTLLLAALATRVAPAWAALLGAALLLGWSLLPAGGGAWRLAGGIAGAGLVFLLVLRGGLLAVITFVFLALCATRVLPPAAGGWALARTLAAVAVALTPIPLALAMVLRRRPAPADHPTVTLPPSPA